MTHTSIYIYIDIYVCVCVYHIYIIKQIQARNDLLLRAQSIIARHFPLILKHGELLGKPTNLIDDNYSDK